LIISFPVDFANHPKKKAMAVPMNKTHEN